jgi:hypothetical protein
LPVKVPGTSGTFSIPEVPVGDEHPVVVDASPVSSVTVHPADPTAPSVAIGTTEGDPGLEADDLVMPVLAGVRLDVGADLVAAREVRVVAGIGKSSKKVMSLEGDQVERVVVGVPVPADPVGLLEAVDLVARLAEMLQGGDAGCAGPDDEVAGHSLRPSDRWVNG